jgi:putative CocE/NonD family hydrolase
VQYYLMGRNVWRTGDAWPVPSTQFERLYLHRAGHANSRRGDGRLGWDAPLQTAADAFVYDPGAPVPTRGGPADLAGVGPRDQRDIEARADVLVCTSAPLERDLDVVGPLSVELFVASSAVDTDITAKLVDVHPTGRALGVQEGILRLRYREGVHRQVGMRPDAVYPIRIDLRATAYTFARGHAIRLEISSSNFPRFDRNLNTGGTNVDETTWVVATNTVHHSPGRASHVLLPVLTSLT